jgi:hypothetical protein
LQHLVQPGLHIFRAKLCSEVLDGIWHAYEPLSFDLADAEGIKEKVRRWRGHLAAVADGSSEPMRLDFVVGAPRNPALDHAYRRALAILRQSEFAPRVFEEGQVDQLVDEIEAEVRVDGR